MAGKVADLAGRTADILARHLGNCLVRRRAVKEAMPGLDDMPPSKRMAIEVYLSVIESPTAGHQERMRAQEHVDRLLGHEVPPGGGSETPETYAAKVRAFMDAAHAAGVVPVPHA